MTDAPMIFLVIAETILVCRLWIWWRRAERRNFDLAIELYIARHGQAAFDAELTRQFGPIPSIRV